MVVSVRQAVASAAVVVGSASSWWLVGFWAPGYGGPGHGPSGGAVLPVDVVDVGSLVNGGVIGGAVLGALARRPLRALAALATAMVVTVLLTWRGPWATAAVASTGTDPRLIVIMTVLLATVSLAAAVVGLAARRGPSGASLVAFLVGAMAVDPLWTRLGVAPTVTDSAVVVPVVAAVAIAVGWATPLRAALVVVVGVLGFVVVRALMVGLVNAAAQIRRGRNPDGPGQWLTSLDYGLAVVRSYLGTDLPGYPLLIGAVVCGALVGLGRRVIRSRRLMVEPERDQPAP